MEKAKVKSNTIKDYLYITVGVFIYVFSWTGFLIPNEVASGGLTGACAIIQMGTGIPVAYSFPVLNAMLIIIASIILGRGFGFRTIYAILLSTVLFKIMPNVDFLVSLPGHPLFIDERILIPIIGGLIEALGIAIIITHGGSTGGTDIVALIINKYWPVSPGRVFLISDFFIIASVLLIPGKTLSDIVFGYMTMVTFSVAVDYFLTGTRSSVKVLIFSEKYSEIADYIIKDMDRGVTALNAVGWYTGNEKKVLLVMVRKSELHEITRAVKTIDPRAFVCVSPASDVYGEGFEEIKTGIQKKKKQ